MNSQQTIPTINEYNQTAKEIMNKVAGKQPQEVKQRVEAVQKTVSKTAGEAVEPNPEAKN